MLHSLQFLTDYFHIRQELSQGGSAFGLWSVWRYGDIWRFGDHKHFSIKMVLYIVTQQIRLWIPCCVHLSESQGTKGTFSQSALRVRIHKHIRKCIYLLKYALSDEFNIDYNLSMLCLDLSLNDCNDAKEKWLSFHIIRVSWVVFIYELLQFWDAVVLYQ